MERFAPFPSPRPTCNVFSPAVAATRRQGRPVLPCQPFAWIIAIDADMVKEIILLHVLRVVAGNPAGAQRCLLSTLHALSQSFRIVSALTLRSIASCSRFRRILAG